MPRTARIVIPGAWYHITARGIERRPIFGDDRDRRHFLELLAELTERFRLRLHAYVLMDNHYHLLCQLPEPNLSRAIQWLNLSHTASFNRRHHRVGYLFQGRFKSVLVDPVGWGFSLSAYIHLNPARVTRLRLSKPDVAQARRTRIEDPGPELIRRRLAALRTHQWSSYHAYLKPHRAPPWLDTQSVLQLGGGPPAQRPLNYRNYVEDQLRQGNTVAPWDNLHERIILGAEEFLEQVRKAVRGANTGQETPPRWARKPIPFSHVVAAVEKLRRERWLDFRDRHADRGRDLVLTTARRATNLSLAELARETGLKGPAQAAVAIKRYQACLARDQSELRRAKALANTLRLTFPTSNDK